MNLYRYSLPSQHRFTVYAETQEESREKAKAIVENLADDYVFDAHPSGDEGLEVAVVPGHDAESLKLEWDATA